MRIAVTIERLDIRRGGAEVGTLRLIEQLVGRGHQVHLFTEAAIASLPAGVQVHTVPLPPFAVAWRQWRFAERTARALRAARFDASVAGGRGLVEDIFWAQNGAHPATIEGAVRSYYYNPLLRWLRRLQDFYSAKGWVYRRLERRCFARTPQPYVIAVSEMVAREYERYYGVSRNRARVAYYQIDLQRFSPRVIRGLRSEVRVRLGTKDNDLVILFVGQNFKRKGVRLLVEAAALLRRKRKDFLVIIGGGFARQAKPYEALAQRLGCPEQVRFVGQNNRVEELYAAADVFCLPTFYDSFGMVVLEAMACGLPAITSQFGGVSEIVQNGINGFVLQGAHDPAELASLLELLFDAELRKRIGAVAVQTAETVCLQNSANDIAAVVEELAILKQQEKTLPHTPEPASR